MLAHDGAEEVDNLAVVLVSRLAVNSLAMTSGG